jgi:surface antigen
MRRGGILVAALLLLSTSCGGTQALLAGHPSADAVADIPAAILQLYETAGNDFGVPWQILAGIGKVETDHGRSTLPGVLSGANSAGAEGPMQFLPPTFAQYALAGHTNIYEPSDAVFAAAHMLAANGATNPATVSHAIFQYNHDPNYVDQVLQWSVRYVQAATGPSLTGVPTAITANVSPLFTSVPATGFPTSTFPFGQCTWYAAFEWSGPRHTGVTWPGNATDWLAGAQTQGYATSPIPSVGAIAVYRAGGHYSIFGHVAIVTGVARDSYTVSEMNFVGLAKIDLRMAHWPDPDLEGFIPT